MKKQIVTVTVNNEHLARTLGLKPGAKTQVEVKNGVPVNREWRNRFKDAEFDGCITISENTKVTPVKSKKEDEDK